MRRVPPTKLPWGCRQARGQPEGGPKVVPWMSSQRRETLPIRVSTAYSGVERFARQTLVVGVAGFRSGGLDAANVVRAAQRAGDAAGLGAAGIECRVDGRDVAIGFGHRVVHACILSERRGRVIASE